MKKCTACKRTLEEDNFYSKKRSKINKDGTVHSWAGLYAKCKNCVNRQNKLAIGRYKDWHKEYRDRPENKLKAKINRAKMYKERKQDAINLIKSTRKMECVECGYNKSFSALDFHHVKKEDKKHGIHSLMNSVTKVWKTENIDTLLNELKKCVILCSNCHREHHAVYDFNIKPNED